jgi:3-deoxy-7-phosphoheptulonate synthase/chorismate mutase
MDARRKPDPLNLLRERASEINRALLDLLNERLEVVEEIRRVKSELSQGLYEPEREAEMLQELLLVNRGPMPADRLRAIFKEVFALSLSHMETEERVELRVHRRPGEADRRVMVRGHGIGGGAPVLVAGPCSVDRPEFLRPVAERLAGLGCRFLRGGAYKPRTSPYAFQGLGPPGWRLLREVADEHDMAVVSEVLDPRHLDDLHDLVDVIQVGARNMYNYELLKCLGELGKPVLLKRGFSATIEELLLAAEYVLAQGNPEVILCERGIRTFERWTRSTLDISAVPLLKNATALPVIVDVAHAAGRRDILAPLGRAALAAGADGVMIEVHPRPDLALSDNAQQLDLDALSAFWDSVFGAVR